MAVTSFPHITYRETVVGRRAIVLGTGLQAWEIVKVCRALDNDPGAVAAYFQIDPALVHEGLRYAELNRGEIEEALRLHEMHTPEFVMEHYPEIFSRQPATEPEPPQH